LWVSILSLLTLWGRESSLSKKDGCISLPLRLRRFVGALTLVVVQEIPVSIKEVPDADEVPGTVQVSHGSVDDCLVAVVQVGEGETEEGCWLWCSIDILWLCVPLLSLLTLWGRRKEER